MFSWKDINHPKSGGAEIVTHELAKQLVKDGNTVTLLTARYPNSQPKQTLNGVDIIRVGNNSLTHYCSAWWYYRKHLKGNYDIIIEQINTLPYLTKLYSDREKTLLFYHQLAREIWLYEMIFPLSLIGFMLEPLYTWLESRFRTPVIVVSQSTKNDLVRYGFSPKNISVISLGLTHKPLQIYNHHDKQQVFTVMFHSSLRAMKRPADMIRAFVLFNQNFPETILWMSGGGDQGELRKLARRSGCEEKIHFLGRVSDEEKLEYMKQASVLCSTSVKEGWGLIVTEAHSMATPTITYDVDGLRDATTFGGGYVCRPDPQSLADSLASLYNIFTNDTKQYDSLCQNALSQSKKVTFEQSYTDLQDVLKKL